MEKPMQDGKKAKWIFLLSKFDIKYVTQKFVKGRAIADHLAHYSPEEAEEIQWDFPDEDIIGIEVESWKMHFDGATNQNGSGIGVLLIYPKRTHIPFSGRLNFPTTNNATEYEACIVGLRVVLGLRVKEFELYGDSALIISRIQNRWKIDEEMLMLYHECLQKWASKFSKIHYQYVPRMQNQIADALATMAFMMDGPKEDKARPIVLEQKEESAYCMSIEEDEGMNREGEWYSDILQYLKDGTYPKSADKNDQLTIRRLSTNYIIRRERCWYRILFALNLRAGPRKIQKYYFLSMGPWEHLEWRGTAHSNTGAHKVHFLAKMTKTPLVNPGLTESQKKSKSPQNITFHSFTSNPSSSDIFTNFDQIWPGVYSWWALETIILIWPLEQIETNAIAKIIKFSFQRLFIGWNQS